MNNRINKKNKIKEYFSNANITDHYSDKIIVTFDLLKKKFLLGENINKKLQLLLEEIIQLLMLIDKKNTMSFYLALSKIAENYTSLFPAFLTLMKDIQDCPTKYLVYNENQKGIHSLVHYRKLISQTLVEPMLITLANKSPYCHTSKYFGDIIIMIQKNEMLEPIIQLLNVVDDYLDAHDKICSKALDMFNSPLSIYATFFRYLNAKNQAKIQMDFTYSDYLFNEQKLNSKNTNEKILPCLIIVDSPTFLQGCLNDNGGAHATKHHLIKDMQAILMTIDSCTEKKSFVKGLIFEIHRFYYSQNSHENDLMNTVIKVNKEMVAKIHGFIKLFSKENQDFLKYIKVYLLNHLKGQLEKKISMDELSMMLLGALFDFSPAIVRNTMDELIHQLEINIDGSNKYRDILSLCICISNAFSVIENALFYMSKTLYLYSVRIKESLIKLNDDLNQEGFHYFNGARIKFEAPLKKQEGHAGWQEYFYSFNFLNMLGNYTIDSQKNFNNNFSYYALIEKNNFELMESLCLISSRDISLKSKDGMTPLSEAIIKNRKEIVEVLIRNGATLRTNKKEDSFLHLAADHGSYQVIPVLISRGMQPSKLSQQKQPPLFLLCQYFIKQHAKWNVDPLSYQNFISSFLFLLINSKNKKMSRHNNDEVTLFFDALHIYQKNIILLYLLHESSSLNYCGNSLPFEIILRIASTIDGYVPGHVSGNFYRDMFAELEKNKKLFNQFYQSGIDAILSEMAKKKKVRKKIHKTSVISSLRKFNFFNLMPNQSVPEITSKEKLLNYYMSRNLMSASRSLAAILFAKKEFYFHKKPGVENKKNRREMIQKWKKTIKDNDPGLVNAIFTACKNLGIHEIDREIYHFLSSLLFELFIKNKNSQTFSTSEFSSLLQERIKSDLPSRLPHYDSTQIGYRIK